MSELCTLCDPELAVGVGEVELNGLDGHEERLGDLGVRRAGSGEIGDPSLARGEQAGATGGVSVHSHAARGELAARTLPQGARTALVRYDGIDQPPGGERPRHHTAVARGLAVLKRTLCFAAAEAEGLALSVEAVVEYASRARGERKRPPGGWESLTPTEEKVVELAAQGLTNPQIAERMFISRSTVKAHLAHVFRKLDVRNRAELTAQAVERQR